jgi:hypothetical protein
MRLFNPITHALLGDNINRETGEYLAKGGFAFQ